MEDKFLSFNDTTVGLDAVAFQGQKIPVKNRLSVEDIVQLVRVYMEEYFAQRDDNAQIIFAEYGYKSLLFTIVTGYNIQDGDFMGVASTSLFDDVENKVTNSKHARSLIRKTIERMEAQNSIDSTIRLVGEKLIETLDSISKAGVNEQFIKEIYGVLKEIKDMRISKEEPVYFPEK